MMSGSQLRRGVSFLEFLPQSTFVNGSEFLNYQNGSSPLLFPVLLGPSDAKIQNFSNDLNSTFLQKKEINSFYFYKVSLLNIL